MRYSYPNIMKIFVFLVLVIVLEQTFNRRIFSKTTSHVEGSRPDVFFKKCILKSFTKFSVLESFFDNVVGLSLIKKRLQDRCFPVTFCKNFKNTYFAEYLQRLFLPIASSAVEKVLIFIFILATFAKLL